MFQMKNQYDPKTIHTKNMTPKKEKSFENTHKLHKRASSRLKIGSKITNTVAYHLEK